MIYYATLDFTSTYLLRPRPPIKILFHQTFPFSSERRRDDDDGMMLFSKGFA
jgi:hypothetical protein